MAARAEPDRDALPGARSAAGASRGTSRRVAMLVLAFIALPLFLYGWFRAADADKRAIVLGATQEQVTLIAAGLRPLLDRDDPAAVERIDAAVRALAVDGRTLRVIRASRNAASASGFLVAAHPPVSEADFASMRAKLREAEHAGLDRASCNGSTAIEARVGGAEGDAEILAAAALIATPASCWTILIGWSSAPFFASSLGRPYWQTREVALSAAAYLALVAVVLSSFLALTRKLRRAAATGPAAVETLLAAPTPQPALPFAVPHIKADLGDPRAEAVDLRKRVADLVFEYHDAVTARGLSFSYEAVQPAVIRGTRSLIDGAVTNLLDTALAASRPGDVVRVIVRTDEGKPCLIVEDGGHAIALDGKSIVDRRDIRHVIWIANRNVEAMGGHLAVERQPSGVSRFVASFPQTR